MCGRAKVGWRGLNVELAMIVYEYGSPGPVAEKCQESKIDTWWTAKERVARQRARGIAMACFWYLFVRAGVTSRDSKRSFL